MCKIHRIHCSINALKNSINKITGFIAIFKKLENATVNVSFLSGIVTAARFTKRLITCLSHKPYLTTHLCPNTCLILKIF